MGGRVHKRLSGKLFERYRQELRVRNYAKRTITTYVSMVQAYVRWLDGRHPRDVDAEVVRAFLLDRLDRGRSRSYVDQAISALRFLYIDLYGWEDLEFDVHRPRREAKLPYVPTKAEILRMAELTLNRKHRCTILFLYASGLRVSELVALRVKDIDPNRMTVHVRGGKGRKDRSTLFSERLVPDYHWLAGERDDLDPLFIANTGRRLSVRSVQHVVAGAALRADLPETVSPHSLRHAFATHLLEAGIDLLVVKRLLGHAKATTTARYVHMKDPNRFAVTSPL